MANKSEAGIITLNKHLQIFAHTGFESLFFSVSPDPPEIQNKVGSTVRGIEDQSITLTCVSRGGYPAPYLGWYRDNTKLTSTRTEAAQADGTTTVNITSSFTATRNLDKTNYTCQSSFDPPDLPLITPVMLYLSCKYI